MADYRGKLQLLANKNLAALSVKIGCLMPHLVLFDTVRSEADVAFRGYLGGR
jgi:hypothetical protein